VPVALTGELELNAVNTRVITTTEETTVSRAKR
jgi:hypothetical protein